MPLCCATRRIASVHASRVEFRRHAYAADSGSAARGPGQRQTVERRPSTSLGPLAPDRGCSAQFLSDLLHDLFGPGSFHPYLHRRKGVAMGTLSAGLNIALQSLLTEQGAIATTANNIAN